MPAQVIRKRTYVVVWVALMCLTGLTGGLSLIDLQRWNAVIAFLIAAAKAGLVVTFFMHLRYEKQRTVWIWAAVGVSWLAILMVLTMNDYLTRGFLRVAGK